MSGSSVPGRLAAAVLAGVLIVLLVPAPVQGAEHVDRLLIFSLPAVTWQDIEGADTPTLDRLVEDGAVAALAGRTAARRPSHERGYLTLGAGNRAFISGGDERAHLAYRADAGLEGGSAAEASQRRTGLTPSGDIVHLGYPHGEGLQRLRLYGAQVGSLGEALRQAGVRRAVVSAGDLSLTPQTETFRRASVFGLIDHSASVDTGKLEGLLRAAPHAPYGVEADHRELEAAVARALRDARVVLVDPGDTLRADAFAPHATDEQADHLRTEALERSDRLLGRLTARMGPDDLLIVLAPSAPTSVPSEHLLPAVAVGPGIERGWLTSPSTRREGQVTLVDVAPTVLHAFGIDSPTEMSGTPMRSVADDSPGRISTLIDLDEASSFRESFSLAVFYAVGAMLSLLGLVAFIAFLWRPDRRLLTPLMGLAYLGLAIFPASHLVRVMEVHRLGEPLAHVLLWSIALALAAIAYLLPGPRWGGGVALLLVSLVLFGVDTVLGGPLQVNGIWGHSPLVAGRFYGLSNPGHAILISAGLLGLLGLAELRGQRRAPIWVGGALLAIVLVIGLPPFGANFGGFLTGIAAFAVAYSLARGRRIRWRWLAGVGGVGALLATALALVDFTRSPESRTHLGRFVDHVADGGMGAFLTVIERKAASSIGSLVMVRWTYVIPVGLAVVALLLFSPRGVLKQVLPQHPLLYAALIGSLVAAVVGFAVNDSGVAMPAMVLGHVVPFLVLMAVEVVLPKDKRPAPLPKEPATVPPP